MQKLLNVWEFYKSTLPVSIGISILPAMLGGFSSFAGAFLTFGLLASLAFKELGRPKNEYNFYFNNGLSKQRLWIFAFIGNCIFVIVAAGLIKLAKHA
ncbi:MAG: hypothetical protein EOO51_06515 [Flavobacterium sp.]|nr:MAG: hypothetical protein EOO51_06515 [Flavobacterium sp.]